jgi:hypothetical protein
MDFQQESGLIAASATSNKIISSIDGKKFDDIIGAGYYSETI